MYAERSFLLLLFLFFELKGNLDCFNFEKRNLERNISSVLSEEEVKPTATTTGDITLCINPILGGDHSIHQTVK